MAQISLGQIFLVRRELKHEIMELDSKVASLAFHREDKEKPTEDYNEVFNTLTRKRSQLVDLDMIIEKCNSMPDTITFKDQKMTLNMARHLKTHLSASLCFLSNQVRCIEPILRREDKENETDWSMNPPMNLTKKYKYVVIADVPGLKEQMKEVQKSISELDGLIQQTDWSLMVEDPAKD